MMNIKAYVGVSVAKVRDEITAAECDEEGMDFDEATANGRNLKKVAKNGEQSNENEIRDTEYSDKDVEDKEESSDEDEIRERDDNSADMMSSNSGTEDGSEYNPSDADRDGAADNEVNEYRNINKYSDIY